MQITEMKINWEYIKLLWDDTEIVEYQEEINSLRAEILLWEEDLVEAKKQIDILANENIAFRNKLEWKAQEDELEKYWNNKHKKGVALYNARGTLMDVRQFINPRDINIPTVSGTSNDAKANNALKWVYENIRYTLADETNGEFWKYSWETIDKKRGDCEDGAILMYNIMLKSGIPYWRIRLNAGDVQGGGHAYITYLREKDNTWYVLDWCYWYNESVNYKKKWSDAKKYFGIWFSWNELYIFNETDYKVISNE